jgi:hypothetical protein
MPGCEKRHERALCYDCDVYEDSRSYMSYEDETDDEMTRRFFSI